MPQAKAGKSRPVDELTGKLIPNSIEIQRGAISSMAEDFHELHAMQIRIIETLNPTELEPSFLSTIQREKYSKAEAIELLAYALSECEQLKASNSILIQTHKKIFDSFLWLAYTINLKHGGGRKDKIEHDSKAREIASEYHYKNSKHISAKELSNQVSKIISGSQTMSDADGKAYYSQKSASNVIGLLRALLP